MNDYLQNERLDEPGAVKQRLARYFSELQQGSSLLQKRFGKLETIAVTVVAIRLYPAMGIANFRRNPEFKAVYYIFYEMLRQKLAQEKALLEMRQYKNIFMLVFEAGSKQQKEVIKLLRSLYRFWQWIDLALASCGKDLRVTAAMAVDYGRTHFTRETEDTSKYVWLGDVLERADILCNNAAAAPYPDLLISQAVYQELDIKAQELFPKAYYINHIACYGCDLQTL